MHLTEEEQHEINRLVREAEATSGAELLILITPKADVYPEIPWKAFALGAVFAGLAATAAAALGGGPAGHAGFAGVVLIAAAATAALVAVWVPGIARLFLSSPRVEGEVRQYAEAAFLQRELFATRDRVGVLMLIARFEREAVLVADVGIRAHVTPQDLAAIESGMKPLLVQGDVVRACAHGLTSLATLLQGCLAVRPGANEIAVSLIEERSA